jgi:glycosyltransferase involved in cell wall biosynthesis
VSENENDNRRLQLAYFSPLPPVHSGIADYSAELLPYLAESATLTLFIDPAQYDSYLKQTTTPPISNLSILRTESQDEISQSLIPNLPIQQTYAYPPGRWKYDVALYHMGNSDHHRGIYEMLTRYPGVVVLHDVFIHQLLAHATVGQGNYAAYARELGFARGIDGVHLANAIRAGYETHPLFELPLSDRLVRSSLGLIVHSHYAAALVKAQRPRCPVEVIPAPIKPYVLDSHDTHNGRSCRPKLNVSDQTVVFASPGQVTQNKQAEQLLRVFKELHRENNDTFLLFIGELLPEVNLAAIVGELGLAESVAMTGYVATLEAFVDWIQTADVIVNLRYPTVGETSATALRALAAGRPLIVLDHGWYGELPDSAALKVVPLNDVALLDAMRALSSSLERRRRMGQDAAAYARQTHHPAQAAKHYMTFLRRLLAQWQQPYA